MNQSNQVYEIALSKLNGIGSIRAKHIISKTSAANFFENSIQARHNITGFSISFLSKLNYQAALNAAKNELKGLNKIGANYFFYGNNSYPERLKNCYDAPLILYHYGKGEISPNKSVAIVGTRDATIEGKKITQELVDELSSQNITIISGLAYGIDVCAHQNSLNNHNQTIAVLAHGFNYIYPYVHKFIAKSILKNGLLVSEHSITTPPKKFFFPKRNRIIAGLADATIIVESKKKGGALITAQLANDYNRDVFAYPGEINNPLKTGCNQLIQKNKAHLITSSSDFLYFMNWNDHKKKQSSKNRINLKGLEKEIFLVINYSNKEIKINSIKEKLNISIQEIQVNTLSLELKGLIKKGVGQTYYN